MRWELKFCANHVRNIYLYFALSNLNSLHLSTCCCNFNTYAVSGCLASMTSGSPQQLQHLVAEYSKRLCACIEAAKDAHTVKALLQQAKDILCLHAVTPDAIPHADQHTAAASSAAPAGATLLKAISAPPFAASGAPNTGDVASDLAGQAAAVQRCAACFEAPCVAVLHTFSGTPFSEFAGCLLSGTSLSQCPFKPRWIP